MAKIGRYEIIEELGNGEMASVYLARDPFIKREVAIKVLAYELTQDSLFLNFFYQEAEAIASLEHPTIVPIYDFGLHGIQPYIVMRYMPNGSLERRLKRRGLNRQELCDLMGRVAEGLDEAHTLGIVHRDVKPSNILFNQSYDAFLTDFRPGQVYYPQNGHDGRFVGGYAGVHESRTGPAFARRRPFRCLRAGCHPLPHPHRAAPLPPQDGVAHCFGPRECACPQRAQRHPRTARHVG
jgi:hypothetical protein